MRSVITKTQQTIKTFYSSPQMQMKKETGDFIQDLSDKSRDFCSLNPNSQKCKTINKKL